VVDAVNTATPATWYVSTDHLNRPVRMTDGAKATVWQATWKPFGEPQSITGSATVDVRFPGQWFQLESGLHQNWWRHYDPTTGRYTQADPLGFVDGPSVYGYARQNALLLIDPTGERSTTKPGPNWGPPSWPYRPYPGDGPAPWWWSPSDFLKACLRPFFMSKPPNQLTKRCQKVAAQCRAQCLDQLPTTDYGFEYWNCVADCMEANGCPR